MKEMLSKNFSVDELRCKDLCEEGKYPHPGVPVILEFVRYHFGNKYSTQCIVVPGSCCRCFKENERVQKKWYEKNTGKEYVPGSSKSRHMNFDAVDFKVKIRYQKKDLTGRYEWLDVEPKEVYDFLDDLFPNSLGLGLYNWGVHVDMRPKRARWGI